MFDTNIFPQYVGFGKLDKQTITENADKASADYFFQEKPVHRITYDKVNSSWEFKDTFDDSGSISYSKDIKNAVMMHFYNLNCETNSIFNFVRETVCSRGNIYFQNLQSKKDKGGCSNYFPAGRLVILRLPIFFDNDGKSKAEVLINKIPYIEDEERPLLKLCEAYNTSILFPEMNGKTTVVPVLMFEYIVTLASLLDVVNWMADNNLLSSKRIFRMLIQDATCKNQHSIQTFDENANDAAAPYTILLKGMDDSTVKFEELEKKVIESFGDRN